MTAIADIDPCRMPLGHAGFERMARLCREAPHLKPLAFEALLHMPLAYLLERAAEEGGVSGRMVHLTPLHICAPDLGIAELSHAVFSDVEHFRQFMPERELHAYTAADTASLFAYVLASSSAPLVADPRTPHALCFGYDEMCVWMTLWTDFPTASDPFTQGGCGLVVVSNQAQVLLDRLAVFFPGFESVERAYLVGVRRLGTDVSYRSVLMIDTLDDAVFERILRAMPLLSLDLHQDEAPQYLLSLNRHPGLKRDVIGNVPPVYDREIAPGRPAQL